MAYFDELRRAAARLSEWLDLRHEQGCDVQPLVDQAVDRLQSLAREAEAVEPPADLAKAEPIELDDIRALRPRGPRALPFELTNAQLRDKMLGAWLGRAAGCILGIPCEGMSKVAIRSAAKAFGMRYPLANYWTLDPKPGNAGGKHYGITPRRKFLRDHIDRIGTDDDLTYTLLGLLILEDYGVDFTTDDVGDAWLRYLPLACTAERVALDNLRQGIEPPETARIDNPYQEWIGADIRSDPWAYAAAGLPEVAATFAYRDASVSHVRTGTYGEMFFAAAIAAAFVLDDIEDVIKTGLSEIPKQCRLAKTVKQILRWCRRDGDWDTTTDRILEKYEGMAGAHTLHNAALTIAGLLYGQGSFQKTIALTVMGGVDTDCTAATAGSLFGAMVGARRLPKKWVRPLGDRAESYLQGKRRWASSDIADRFCAVAAQVRDVYT
ncbi:MAG: ADP-ribosylglycohydrolase family protein [bacterium]